MQEIYPIQFLEVQIKFKKLFEEIQKVTFNLNANV